MSARRKLCIWKSWICAVIFVALICSTYHRLVSKLRCIYSDTGSENLGIPNFYLNCGASPEDCQYYGYEPHWTRDNKSQCCAGDAVPLCVYPNHPTTPRTTLVNELKIISWNIYQMYQFEAQDGQVERTCRIPGWISSHYPEADVISFQELFTDGCWGGNSSVREMLKYHRYFYNTKPVQGSVPVFTVGLVIASKWPIEYEDSLVFSYVNLKSIVHYNPKGALYVKIRKRKENMSQVYHVFCLHLSPSGGKLDSEIRFAQMKELVNFIESQNMRRDDPVIITGDFNQDFSVKKNETESLLRELGGVLPLNTSTMGYTFDLTTNMLTRETQRSSAPNEWNDYIVYRKQNKAPKWSTFKVVPARTQQPMSFCWAGKVPNLGVHRMPKTSECSNVRNHSDLSDHYPVIGHFVF